MADCENPGRALIHICFTPGANPEKAARRAGRLLWGSAAWGGVCGGWSVYYKPFSPFNFLNVCLYCLEKIASLKIHEIM